MSRSVTDVASRPPTDTQTHRMAYDHNYVVRRDNTDESGLNVVGTLGICRRDVGSLYGPMHQVSSSIRQIPRW
jgi:hypothetical protein